MRTLFIIPMLLLVQTNTTLAHDAPTGWAYDPGCCNTTDCRQIGEGSKSAVRIVEVTGGYKIIKPGQATPDEFVKWDSTKVRRSKDEHYHWCSGAGLDYTNTICLYVPDRGY